MKHDLPDWLEKIEVLVDRCIPYLLILLTIFIVLEFTHVAPEYEKYMILFDQIIIFFFVVDLCFKWHRTKKISKFVRLYWIDIIAVFPFYTMFRVYAAASEAIAAGETVQKFLHETVLLRETKLIREVEAIPKIAREARFIRVFARSLRVLRARWYIVHWHMQKVSKDYKKYH